MKKLWWVRLNDPIEQLRELVDNNSLCDCPIISIDQSKDESVKEQLKDDKSDIEIFFEDLSDL